MYEFTHLSVSAGTAWHSVASSCMPPQASLHRYDLPDKGQKISRSVSLGRGPQHVERLYYNKVSFFEFAEVHARHAPSTDPTPLVQLHLQVNLASGVSEAQGYMCENFGEHFVSPDLGPIGVSSGLVAISPPSGIS